MTISKMPVIEEPKNCVSTEGELRRKLLSESVIIKSFTLVKSILFGTSAIIAFVFFSSCARKAVFQISPVVPAARGYTKVKKDHNKNYNIHISLENLAEPSRLTPSKKTYVVWLVADDNSTKNVGQVKTSTSFLSHTLRGSFETVSPSKPIKVFITAEDDASVQFPGAMMVITTNDF